MLTTGFLRDSGAPSGEALTRYRDGSINFTDENGNTQVTHSNVEDLDHLFRALQAKNAITPA